MVERQIVALDAKSSNLFSHPFIRESSNPVGQQILTLLIEVQILAPE